MCNRKTQKQIVDLAAAYVKVEIPVLVRSRELGILSLTICRMNQPSGEW